MSNSEQQKKNKKQQLKGYARYTGIAFQMAATIFIGVFGGLKIDEYFNFKNPVFTLILSLISVIAAIYFAIKDFIKK